MLSQKAIDSASSRMTVKTSRSWDVCLLNILILHMTVADAVIRLSRDSIETDVFIEAAMHVQALLYRYNYSDG